MSIPDLYDPLLDSPPTSERTHYQRPAQRCDCHPATVGHLYGPALDCLNPGCSAHYGDPTPCLYQRRPLLRGKVLGVVNVATPFGVVEPVCP